MVAMKIVVGMNAGVVCSSHTGGTIYRQPAVSVYAEMPYLIGQQPNGPYWLTRVIFSFVQDFLARKATESDRTRR